MNEYEGNYSALNFIDLGEWNPCIYKRSNINIIYCEDTYPWGSGPGYEVSVHHAKNSWLKFFNEEMVKHIIDNSEIV